MSVFKIKIELGNEAMQSTADVGFALGQVATDIHHKLGPAPREDIVASGKIIDRNGNKVGRWQWGSVGDDDG